MWYVVDGMDGSGKSSVSSFLKEQLEAKGHRVLEITHPTRDTRLGRMEARWLTRKGKAAVLCATFLYILDVFRSVHIMKKMKKKSQYDDFIFVRYIMAVSYLPKKLCPLAYKVFDFVLPRPETKFFVDISAEVAYERILSRGEELETFETKDKLEKTRDKMLMLTPDEWNIIDNSGTFENSKDQVLKVLENLDI
ncbi:MAG: deoxynucleoside kinase [archaeon]|nr:deoxynucleoside kinase [archaeon]